MHKKHLRFLIILILLSFIFYPFIKGETTKIENQIIHSFLPYPPWLNTNHQIDILDPPMPSHHGPLSTEIAETQIICLL